MANWQHLRYEKYISRSRFNRLNAIHLWRPHTRRRFTSAPTAHTHTASLTSHMYPCVEKCIAVSTHQQSKVSNQKWKGFEIEMHSTFGAAENGKGAQSHTHTLHRLRHPYTQSHAGNFYSISLLRLSIALHYVFVFGVLRKWKQRQSKIFAENLFHWGINTPQSHTHTQTNQQKQSATNTQTSRRLNGWLWCCRSPSAEQQVPTLG